MLSLTCLLVMEIVMQRETYSEDDRLLKTLIHADFQLSFTPLPHLGEPLTSDQLQAIFGGDLGALSEIARLVQSWDLAHERIDERSGK
jgi:hypothetical protein